MPPAVDLVVGYKSRYLIVTELLRTQEPNSKSASVASSRIFTLLTLFTLTLLASPFELRAQDAGNTTDSAPVIPTAPTSVEGTLEELEAVREAEFDFPAIDSALKPWLDWKARLAERYGFNLGFDYSFNTQWSDNSVGETHATGGIFRAFFSWDLLNRHDPSRKGTLDFRVENRHRIGTALPPEALAANFGWVGTSAPDWSNQQWGITVLKWRQRLDAGDAPIEVNVGYMSAFSQFDITPYSDNLTSFQNNSIILNPTIGYPSAGSFGISGYIGIPRTNFYVLGMVMDANGQYDSLSFDTLGDGAYFKALEFGWTDQSVSDASFLFNNVHVALWHTDDDNYGVGLTGSYTFEDSRIGTFARLAWANEDASTPYQRYAAAGITKGVFRASEVGLGASWGRPPNSDEDQVAVEAFYRWQVAQNFAITPSIQYLDNPAFNSSDGAVTVLGLRARLTF